MPSLRDMLVFAAGVAAGGLLVRWYVQTHPAELFAEGAAAKIFGQDSPITRLAGQGGAYLDGLGRG